MSRLPLRDDDACCASLDAMLLLCAVMVGLALLLKNSGRPYMVPHKRGGDGMTSWLGKDKNFPPSFVRSSKSLPWYDNLKRKLDEHGFRYKALGDVKVFTGLQFKRFDSGLLIHQRAYIRGAGTCSPRAECPLRQWTLPKLTG
eukprot:g16898.t1